MRRLMAAVLLALATCAGCATVTGEVVFKSFDPPVSVWTVTPDGLELIDYPAAYYLMVRPDRPVRVYVEPEVWDEHDIGDRYPKEASNDR